MALDPLITGVAKTAVGAFVKPTVGFLRSQFSRRGAPFADIGTLGGADRELDEAISVLRGKSASLPATLLIKLKGVFSDRPDSFASADARQFLDDCRVVDLVKTGARRTLRNEDIDQERSQARALHAEIFGENGFYGETLIEDAIAFAVLTLIGHLTPADRQLIELVVDLRTEMQEGFAEVLDALKAQKMAPEIGFLETGPFDEVVKSELRKLLRRRLASLPDLPDQAVALCDRIDSSLRIASPECRAAAYREAGALLARAGRVAEAVTWINKAEALGADVTCERARVAMAEKRFDEAMLSLRDNREPLARGLLLDCIARRDDDAAAVEHFTRTMIASDLTGHALLVISDRMLAISRRADAAALLEQASESQIDENPVLLHQRARHRIAQAVPPEIGDRLMQHPGMLPRASDLHDDAQGRRLLDAARFDLERLSPALPDLAWPAFADQVEFNLTALRLSAVNDAERAVARSAFAERMADPEEAVRLAPLAKLFAVEVDWAPLKAKLAEAERLGGLDIVQLQAALTIVMAEGDSAKIADFVHRNREGLEPFSINVSIVALEIEALARCGRMEEAKALLEKDRATVGEPMAGFLETTFAELEGANTVQQRLDQFEESGSTHDLEILIEVMRSHQDPRAPVYLSKLWRLRRQLIDAQAACDLFVAAGDEQEAEAFLEELGEEARADPQLRTHLAWSRFRQGRLREAAEELAALQGMGVDDANSRHLTEMLAIETGRWSDLEPHVQLQLASRDNRSAEELIATARIARAIGSPNTFDLLRAATAKDPDNGGITVQAYRIATEAGIERNPEVGKWLDTAIVDKKRSGLVEKNDISEVVAAMAQSRAEAERVGGMINAAAVPLFMGISVIGGTQSELVIRQMTANAREADSRKRSMVPLFAGNRMLRNDLRPKSISLEPMSILVLAQLDLLETVIDAFEEVVLPSGTLHNFFEDRGKAGHNQPSRVAQARQIRDAITSGLLKVQAGTAPAGITEVDAEFAALFAAAEVADGYVIDTAPLHPPGTLEIETDPGPYAHRLLSPTGLIEALRAAGAISRLKANAAQAEIKGSSLTFPAEPALPRGKPVFLSNLAVQYLCDAGMLHDLKAHAGKLFISKETQIFADREIAGGAAGEEVRTGIERVRAILAKAIAEGRARVGPARRMKDEITREVKRGDDVIRMSPVVSVLRDAAGVDAFVCDDRVMNKYLQTTDRTGRSIAFLTTPDLLAILRATNVIDDDTVDAAREHLRRSGVGMMLVDPDEMHRAVQSSDWSIGPNAELRAIRDSIHLPLARKVIQMPEERVWLRAVSLSIGYAARKAWIEIEDDQNAERAANFLLDLLPDPAAWSANDPSPDRQAWISEVTRFFVWGVAAMFEMRKSRVERHRNWFEVRVAPMAEQRDPGSLEAVARYLYASMLEPLEAADDDA